MTSPELDPGRDAVLDRGIRSAVAALPAAGPCPDPLDLVRLADHPAKVPSPLAAHLTRCLDCALELEGLLRVAAAGPAPIARRATPARSLAERLRALVRIELPAPLALNPRGGQPAAASPDLRRAMQHYRHGQHGQARLALARARRKGDRSPGLALYLGVLLLLQGRARAALPLLTEAVAERRHGAEGRWYLAQALLRLGHGREALVQLRAAARLGGAHGEAAQGLARDVRALLADRARR